MTSNSLIAKNTLFLYFRMMFLMLISLYTSRVVLLKLGVVDYGIYQTVGGLVALLSYVQGALSIGTSRFLTYELGIGNKHHIEKTFTSIFTIHMAFAILVIIIAESFGLWFLRNKLIIPPDRLFAATCTFHISTLTCVFSIVQMPFNASIMSHEKMGIYAYISIIEAVFKLLIVFLLSIVSYDKLILYSMLLCVVSIGITLFYILYCRCIFLEVKLRFSFDSKIIKSILSYSGWNLLSTTSQALCSQGMIVLISIFFTPSIVSARAVSNQVSMAASQFVSNFRLASNPQIVKKYAMGDREGSRYLVLSTAKYSFFLMLVLCLPIFLLSDYILCIWLVNVPDYTNIFLRITIVTCLFNALDQSFYSSFYATGRIKENSIITCIIFFIAFILTYVFYSYGCTPVISVWLLLVAQILLSLVAKPILMIKYSEYTKEELFSLVANCLSVFFLASFIPVVSTYMIINNNSGNIVLNLFTILIITLISLSITIWKIGLDVYTKNKLVEFLNNRLWTIFH